MPPDRRTPSTGRAYLLWALPVVVIILLVAALAGTSGTRTHLGDRHDPATGVAGRGSTIAPGGPLANPSGSPVWVQATLRTAVRSRLPRSFLGLSFEYWDVPGLDARPAVLRRVFALLHVPGDGPLLLRLGGDSADQAYWGGSPGLKLGPWPFRITIRWLRTLGSVVRSAHLHVLLDLNLAARAPRMAARFARAALRELPPRSVVGFEIGNEPDIFHHWIDYHLIGRAGQFVAPSGWDQYSPSAYARSFANYARALTRVAPQIPLAGPASANPLHDIQWERLLLARDWAWLGLLTVHRYPLSACAHPRAQDFSTVARMLSQKISSGLAPQVIPALRLAREAGLPLRMDELNSVTCEGRRGVSNTFAAALWAPDALFSLWKAGLAGANIHVRQGAPNGAFAMSQAGLVARPLLYGLALFARALGDRGKLARLRVGRTVPSMRLWTVRSGRHLNLVVLDKGDHPAHLMLRVPARGPALVQRLTAPSVRSSSGVTLAGQTLSASGRWVGRRTLQTLTRSGRRYRLVVPAYSGALISFRL